MAKQKLIIVTSGYVGTKTAPTPFGKSLPDVPISLYSATLCKSAWNICINICSGGVKRAYVHLFSCLCCCCFCWWCCTVFSLAGATLHQFRMLNTPKHFAKRLLESFIHPFNTMYARTIEHPIQRTHAGMPHERIWNTDTVQVANMEFVNENFSHTHTHSHRAKKMWIFYTSMGLYEERL